MAKQPTATGPAPSILGATLHEVSDVQKSAAEEQIIAHHRTIDYDTREYPVESLVQKYLTRAEGDENELFVPDYHREHTWSQEQQSRFIESVLLGLPIPYLFLAETPEGRLEIVDGFQRIHTLALFIQNRFKLINLKNLTNLNGFTFKDLPIGRQRRFNRHTLRMIILTERTDSDARRDIFERINTGGTTLSDMEVRWGVNDSPLLRFIRECSEDERFIRLAPLGDAAVKRREREEFVLRFFAYLQNYQTFDGNVVDFLNAYLDQMQQRFDDKARRDMKKEWDRMLAFVEQNFPDGFSKAKGHVRTPRIRYEAIAVGSALALRAKPKLKPDNVYWLQSEEFKDLTTSDASNSKPKAIKRIEYVRDKLLGKL